MASSETGKVKLSKSKSCGRLSTASSTSSGSSQINQNSPMRKSTRQKQSGSSQSKAQAKKGGAGTTGTGATGPGAANVSPIEEEEQKKNGDLSEGGILKALKDLEWEVSEILTEKIPNLVELGCSVLEPDDLHRQLIHVNRKLLERLKFSVNKLEAQKLELENQKLELDNQKLELDNQKLGLENRDIQEDEEKLRLREQVGDLLAEKVELRAQTGSLLADKLELESRSRDLLSEKLELKTHANDLLSEKLKSEARVRELAAEKLDLESRLSDLISEKLELEEKFENVVEECQRLKESKYANPDARKGLGIRKQEEKPLRLDEKPIFDPSAFGFGTIVFQPDEPGNENEEVDDYGEPVRWSSTEDLPPLAPARPFSTESDQSLGTRLSELAYREELQQMNRLKQLEDAKMKEKSVVKELREEIGMLKKWKETAIIETVDKDRLLAEMEQQIVELQREYDESKEECLGHQKVIQELKGSLDQKSHLNSELEHQIQSIGGWSSASRPSTHAGAELVGCGGSSSQDFKSCFARTLDVNGPDRISWLEQELLRARQRCIQTESELEQLQQSHWALLEEYGRLQDDFRALLRSFKTGSTNQVQMISDRLARDVSVLQETVSSLRDELRSKDSVIEDLHRQCDSYESKFDVLQNVEYVRDIQRTLKDQENQIRMQDDALANMRRALDAAGINLATAKI